MQHEFLASSARNLSPDELEKYLSLPEAEKARVEEKRVVLDQFLQIEAPTAADADAAADRLGISRASFYRLRARYMESRSIGALLDRRTGAKKPKELDSSRREQLDAVIQRVVDGASLERRGLLREELFAEVKKSFEASGQAVPARGTMDRRFAALFPNQRYRSSEAVLPSYSGPVGSEIVLDSVAIDLPKEVGVYVARPILTLAFDRASGLILAGSVTDFIPNDDEVLAVLDRSLEKVTLIAALATENIPGEIRARLALNYPERGLSYPYSSTRASRLKVDAVPRDRQKQGDKLSAAFGSDVGDLQILPRLTVSEAAKRRLPGGSHDRAPLKLKDINGLVDLAIDRENVRRARSFRPLTGDPVST